MKNTLVFALTALATLCLPGCSIKHIAVNRLGNAFAGGGTAFTSDEDPELVKSALPAKPQADGEFAGREPSPSRPALWRPPAASLPTPTPSSRRMPTNWKTATWRNRPNSASGLESCTCAPAITGFVGWKSLIRPSGPNSRLTPKATVVQTATQRDVPLLYWTAASWGAAISVSKDNPDLVADQGIVEALIDRALVLNEKFDHGAIHLLPDRLRSEPQRSGRATLPIRARKHFDRAMELSAGHQAGPLVSFAENVSLQKQNRKEFEDLLNQALAVDVNAQPENRLANLIMQRRARWLLRKNQRIICGGTQNE